MLDSIYLFNIIQTRIIYFCKLFYTYIYIYFGSIWDKKYFQIYVVLNNREMGIVTTQFIKHFKPHLTRPKENLMYDGPLSYMIIL